MSRHPHILNAASSLLGIALIIVTALHVAGRTTHSVADEIAWLSAVCFSLSCLFSYFAIRTEAQTSPYEPWADRIFLMGLFSLLAAVTTLAFLEG